jgi:hypothetical protein
MSASSSFGRPANPRAHGVEHLRNTAAGEEFGDHLRATGDRLAVLVADVLGALPGGAMPKGAVAAVVRLPDCEDAEEIADLQIGRVGVVVRLRHEQQERNDSRKRQRRPPELHGEPDQHADQYAERGPVQLQIEGAQSVHDQCGKAQDDQQRNLAAAANRNSETGAE